MWYALLADFIVLVHLLYVGFVIVGQLLIVAGGLLRWQWIRNFWFRLAHLLAIVFVALEALLGIVCPLTIWERDLRSLAGQLEPEGSFVARLVHSVLFYRVDEGEEWIFTACYVTFALLVLATFALLPPRRPRWFSKRASSAPPPTA